MGEASQHFHLEPMCDHKQMPGGATWVASEQLKRPALLAIELLELLASSPHGATEALLVRAHGFNSEMLAGLVRAGLATAEQETMKAGAKPVEVVRVRITDAGRKEIEE